MMNLDAIDVHKWVLRCPGCETMVSVTWSDGNGAVHQDPTRLEQLGYI